MAGAVNMPKIIHVVPHQHFDLVWRRDVSWYVRRRAEIYRQVLLLMRECQGATFTFSQAMPIREFLTFHPKYKAEFAAYLAAGRFEITGGMESIVDLNMSSPGAIMANIQSGMQYFHDELHYDVSVGAFEDAFGVPEQLPAILNAAGYRFYKAGRMPRPGVPDLNGDFIWQAKSGDAIRCVSPGDGNSDWGWGHSDNPDDPVPVSMDQRQEKVLTGLLTAAESDMPDVLYSIMGEEHDLIEDLPELLKQASKVTGANYVFSTYTRYYESLPEDYWNNVPVFGSETDLSRLFTGCYSSRINSKLAPRKLEYNVLGRNFASLAGNVPEVPRYVADSLALLQFHDAICGCHIDENAARLADSFTNSCEMMPTFESVVPFATRLPDFKFRSEKAVNGSVIEWGDFVIRLDRDKLASLEYLGKNLHGFCSISAREDNGTLWTEDYTAKHRVFREDEVVERVVSDNERLSVETRLLCADFKQMWPGFSRLGVKKTLTFQRQSAFVAVKLEINWLGSATEISVRWNAAGEYIATCVAETPFGSRTRTAYTPTADTMTGDSFPILNWCRTGNAAIFNRGTPGHALRNGVLETILLRSPVKRWSPWFPVTPSDAAKDNGTHIFEFVVDLNGVKKSFCQLHQTGIEYNLGNEVKSMEIKAFSRIPDNIVIADAARTDDGRIELLLFEADGKNAVWEDSFFKISENFKPYQIKRLTIVDERDISFTPGVGERRRTVSPVN